MLKILKQDNTFFEPKFFTFSGGEEYVSIEGLERQRLVTIYAQITSSTWLIRLLMLHDALERECIWNVNLFMPYLPYARQDRVCHKGQAFSLEVFADLVKGKFNTITCCDVHSIVACELIPNLNVISQYTNYRNVKSRLDPVDYIVAPDAGSTVKATQWWKYWTYPNGIANETPFSIIPPTLIFASKKRDTNGAIIETYIDGVDALKPGSSCLIVDDICDGGRTFLELSNLLRSLGADKVYLYVTHGILTNGVAGTGCDKVFTTDSLPEKDDGRIVVKRYLY